jgi:hypothetical protein
MVRWTGDTPGSTVDRAGGAINSVTARHQRKAPPKLTGKGQG